MGPVRAPLGRVRWPQVNNDRIVGLQLPQLSSGYNPGASMRGFSNRADFDAVSGVDDQGLREWSDIAVATPASEQYRGCLQKFHMSATTYRVAQRHHRCMSCWISPRKIAEKVGEKTGARKLILALAVFLTVAGIVGYGQSASPSGEITMTAKKYDFTPGTLTVRKGDRVRLIITALDHDHGFKIEAFHIDRRLPKGSPVTVEFVADQAGTFPFQCSQFCGLGHKSMKGSLVVE